MYDSLNMMIMSRQSYSVAHIFSPSVWLSLLDRLLDSVPARVKTIQFANLGSSFYNDSSISLT